MLKIFKALNITFILGKQNNKKIAELKVIYQDSAE
jgi:hypothetical protein